MVGDKNKLQNYVLGLIPYDKSKMKVFLSICGRENKGKVCAEGTEGMEAAAVTGQVWRKPC